MLTEQEEEGERILGTAEMGIATRQGLLQNRCSDRERN